MINPSYLDVLIKVPGFWLIPSASADLSKSILPAAGSLSIGLCTSHRLIDLAVCWKWKPLSSIRVDVDLPNESNIIHHHTSKFHAYSVFRLWSCSLQCQDRRRPLIHSLLNFNSRLKKFCFRSSIFNSGLKKLLQAIIIQSSILAGRMSFANICKTSLQTFPTNVV